MSAPPIPPLRASPDRCRRAAALLVAALLPLGGCKKPEVAAPQPPSVEVITLVPTNAPISAEIIGTLDSPQNVEIRARVEAFVQEMPFVEGIEVTQGDLLFRLDRRPYEETLAAAKGMLAEAEAALKKYEADVNRLQPLAAVRAVPKQDLDNALASVDVGKASVISARARVDAALLDLEYCDVRAPITGLIGARQVSVGELVGKGQPTLMATMSTLDPIWFYCAVSEVDFLRTEAEAKATGRTLADLPLRLVLSDGSLHPEPGRVVFIDRAVDQKTGTLRVRAEFPNPDKILRPGMFARARVDLGSRTNSLMVPERALLELQGRSYVWTIGDDDKAVRRSVTPGRQIGGETLILEGLRAGDRVVTEGLQKVQDGVAVRIAGPASSGAAPTTR
ncbi:MAG: efflux RND transporter periplasmic adaptor subunit [Verrucomicrobiae bacterium]|nr:efflux RND transporter periplasmic adaptor subunit [Verrucomicrobiae bacterium]